MIGLTGDPPAFLTERLRRAEDGAVTYSETGMTRATTLPAGYHHDRVSLHVGDSDEAWERTREAIRLWAAHANAGVEITPAGAPITEGTTVIASRSFGPVVVAAPCRIVYRTDEPTRFGFAYGTLPGHPERGEESFHVSRRADGRVTAEIVAFSRPGDLLTGLGAPLARRIQKAAIRRYLEGIRGHVAWAG